jgi:ATP-dependent Clp protease ATP-binding subunit ClpX
MGFRPPELHEIPTVETMIAGMNAKVAGLAVTKRHLAWIMRRFMVAAALDRPWRPSNVLIIGPTGGGKTYAVRCLLDSIPVVWCEASATEYSDVGWTGRDLPEMYLGLTSARQREIVDGKAISAVEHRARAERWGVVLLDEFDKLQYDYRAGLTNDRSTSKALQAELLKLVEGTETEISQKDHILFRTHNVLHIAMGAFVGLSRVVARYLQQDESEHLYMNVSLANLIHYGFRDELIGRFATVLTLPVLDAGDHVRILSEQILPGYIEEAQDDGITLEVTENGLFTVANIAHGNAIGARALGPVLDAKLRIPWSHAVAGDTIVLDGNDARLEHPQVAA